MRVVVTGAAGMIGSNLVHGLNAIGIDDVIAVDDLTDGPKYRNLLGGGISDYFDRSDFYERFARGGITLAQAVNVEVPRAIAFRPTLVTMWLSVNDALGHVPLPAKITIEVQGHGERQGAHGQDRP